MKEMKRTIAIGAQDFESLRKNRYFLIDKTDFIKEWWENGDAVTLITRPRRFGKTLNLSMTEQFFSVRFAGRSDLFEGLSIWNEPKYRAMQGTWPVISLSFANVKEVDYRMARRKICQLLTNLYMKSSFLIEEGFLKDKDKDFFESVSVDMDDNAATMALYQLADYLSKYYGKKVLIFLDEYDTPLQEAYIRGYWNELMVFIRSLFHATFKTNPYLERGLLTGITRVSKESVFSDLNNLEVVTTTSMKYTSSFGFTEEEVFTALDAAGMSAEKQQVKYWYDGFTFGEQQDIYNPWSITKFLDSGEYGTYWADTSGNMLVSKLMQEGTPQIKICMEELLAGDEIEVQLDEQVVFEQLERKKGAIWSLLLASGYLRVTGKRKDPENGRFFYRLKITNYEVRLMFSDMIEGWFPENNEAYGNFKKALLMEDVDYMNQFMNQVALQVFSNFDAGSHPAEQAEPERFYHGFVLGLIVDLAGQYRITSNRESGFGRYDVMMEPLQKDKPAFVLEFKVFNPAKEKSLEETVQNALAQIEKKEYDVELTARGIEKERIRYFGFAFKGKTVLIG